MLLLALELHQMASGTRWRGPTDCTSSNQLIDLHSPVHYSDACTLEWLLMPRRLLPLPVLTSSNCSYCQLAESDCLSYIKVGNEYTQKDRKNEREMDIQMCTTVNNQSQSQSRSQIHQHNRHNMTSHRDGRQAGKQVN